MSRHTRGSPQCAANPQCGGWSQHLPLPPSLRLLGQQFGLETRGDEPGRNNVGAVTALFSQSRAFIRVPTPEGAESFTPSADSASPGSPSPTELGAKSHFTAQNQGLGDPAERVGDKEHFCPWVCSRLGACSGLEVSQGRQTQAGD